MSMMNTVLATGAGILCAVAVNRNVEADWIGPIAGVILAIALIGFDRASKGRRNAR